MKILITGVDGQLGQTLMQVLSRTHHELYGVNRTTLDITNKIKVSSYLDRLKPDVIVHCAAFTNVDGAEKN
ncbi:sugar nucleotide-binding protein, partial [Bacillus sp. GMs2/2]